MDDRPKLLLIDDGETYAEAIARQLPEFQLIHPGFVEQPRIPDGPKAIAWLAKRADEVDALLLDMRFDVPDEDLLALPEAKTPRRQRRYQGVAILRRLREAHPHLPVVLLTSVADLALSQIASELSATSLTYLLDGDDLDALRIPISRALRDARRDTEEGEILWGRDPSFRAIRRRLGVLARGRLPVILEGETGTGKSFLAERTLHAHSGREGGFITLDLSTLPPDLIPAHLFGVTRGAYTGAVNDRKGAFELADGGTLFIDEIQNASLEVQKLLLLVLQDRRVRPLGASLERQVDVKVIAASSRPLAEEVAAGRFRADLFMRLSPATRIKLPPLRERPSDLPFLARRFVTRAGDDPDVANLREAICGALGRPHMPLALTQSGEQADPGALTLTAPPAAWRRLMSHSWPGNLRELSMVMHNLVLFTLVGALDALEEGLRLTSARFQIDPGLVEELLSGGLAPSEDGRDGIEIHIAPRDTLNQVSSEVERQYLLRLFEQTDGDFSEMAARLLGDEARARAVRLRFNQLGLKVRALRGRR